MTINVRNPLIFDAALTANWAMEEGALRQVMEIAARENSDHAADARSLSRPRA